MYRVGIDGEADTWTQHERLEDALVRVYDLRRVVLKSQREHIKLMMELAV